MFKAFLCIKPVFGRAGFIDKKPPGKNDPAVNLPTLARTATQHIMFLLARNVWTGSATNHNQ